MFRTLIYPSSCWARKKWNKIARDIKLVFHSSNIYSLKTLQTWWWPQSRPNHVVSVTPTKLVVFWLTLPFYFKMMCFSGAGLWFVHSILFKHAEHQAVPMIQTVRHRPVPQRTGFDSRPIRVRCVVDKVILGQVLLPAQILRFPPVSIIPPTLQSHISFTCNPWYTARPLKSLDIIRGNTLIGNVT